MASSLEDTLFPVREDGLDRRACPNCKEGRLYLNGSANGAFVACSNYRMKGNKQCKYTRTFSGDEYNGEDAGVEVGMHPEHNAMIYVKKGRYGRCFSLPMFAAYDICLYCRLHDWRVLAEHRDSCG